MIHWFLHMIGVRGEILAPPGTSLAGVSAPAGDMDRAAALAAGRMVYLSAAADELERGFAAVSNRAQRHPHGHLADPRHGSRRSLFEARSKDRETADPGVCFRRLAEHGPARRTVRRAKANSARAAAALGLSTTDAEVRKSLNHISRAKLAHDALYRRAQKLITPLAEKYDLRFYRLADRLDRLPVAGPDWSLPERKPKGPSTRLGDGIVQLIEEAAGREIAGIVLFSDGQNNAGLSPAEAVRAAAEVSAPIFSVPVRIGGAASRSCRDRRVRARLGFRRRYAPRVGDDRIAGPSRGAGRGPVDRWDGKDPAGPQRTRPPRRRAADCGSVVRGEAARSTNAHRQGRPEDRPAGRRAGEQFRQRGGASQRREAPRLVCGGAAALAVSLPEERHAARSHFGRARRRRRPTSCWRTRRGGCRPVRHRRCRKRSTTWQSIIR